MAKSMITAVKSSFNVAEGEAATAWFSVTPGLTANADVNVSVTGWGAVDGVDFSGFSYTVDGVNFVPVVNGLITIPAGTTSFALKANVLADANTVEYGEALAFVVTQTPQSAGALENSYWVNTVGYITDTSALPAPKSSITADAANASSAAEGTIAVAKFNVSPSLSANAEVAVGIQGHGAVVGVDYSAVEFSVDGVNYASVVNGLVTVPAGSSAFFLRTSIAADGVIEGGENIVFTANQTTNSEAVLQNSYFVSSVVSITDTTAPPPAPSTITAMNNGFEVIEGGYAMGRFKLDKALSGDAKIAVNVEGYSASVGVDTTGPLEYRIGTGAWVGVTDDTVTLTSGTTKFDLRVKTVNDLKTESAEVLNFTVVQVSGNLSNSYYVNSMGTLVDQAPVLRQGTSAYETLTGSNTKQDVFDMTVGQSLAKTGSFDIIRSFDQGDVIKLPEVINNWAISGTTANALTGVVGTVTEAKLFATIQETLDGQYCYGGPGSVLKIQNGANTYLLADTNGDGVFNTGLNETTPDMMIKLIGVGTYDLITGESILA